MRLLVAFSALTLLGFVLSDAANAASFPCDRARAPDERAICANRALNDADVRVATKWAWLMGVHAMGARGNLGDSQRAWLAERRRCGADRTCLARSYAAREKALQADYDGLPKPI